MKCESKYKKILINVYFGKLNNYFDLWLESCKYQTSYTFLLFTDDQTEYDYPDNVKVVYTTFDKLKARLRKIYDFDFVLDRPYKLCDYKAAYGDIFSDYIEGYDFWGYCDLDLIFGNLDGICTDAILDSYDKISERGHFALYRNNEELRNAYKLRAEGTLFYKDVFSSPKIFGFDESWFEDGINHILIKNRYRVMLRPINYADILRRPYGLRTIREIIEDENVKKYELSKKKIFYIFNKGVLTQYSLIKHRIVANEELYIHLLKRPMVNNVTNKNCFKIVPRNRFENIRNAKKVNMWSFFFINENSTFLEKSINLVKRAFRKMGRLVRKQA